MTKMKGIIALILSVSLCFSCFAVGDLSLVSAENTTAQLATENFEDNDYTNALWETKAINTAGTSSDNSNATVVTPYSIIDDSGNNVLLPNRASANKSPIVMMYKQDMWPTQTLDSVTMKVKFPSTSNSSFDGAVSIMPFYLEKRGDHTEGTVIYIQLQNSNGYLSARCGNNSKYAKRVSGNSLTSGTISTAGWVEVKMEYDYSEWEYSSLTIKYTFTDVNNNSATATVEYTLTLVESGYDGNYFRFGIGSYASASYITYFDDISCEFAITPTDEVNNLYNEYKDVFELTEWDDSYAAKVMAIADEYMSFSDEGRENCEDLIEKLRELIEGTSVLAEQREYLSKYDSLLAKAKPTEDSDEQAVQEALSEYEALTSVSKMFLVNEYAKLKFFESEFVYYRADDDYSPFNFDFENGLTPLENQFEDDIYAINEVVEDPTAQDNKVLKLKGQQSAFLLKYWPTLGAMKKVSFRAYCPRNNAFTPWRAAFSYIDDGNYYAFQSSIASTGKVRLTSETCADYIRKSDYVQCEIDLDGWVNYEFVFSESQVMITAKDKNNKVAMRTADFAYGGNFGFTFFQSYNKISSDLYVDDLSVVFSDKAGDFDMNEDPVDINVYFSGNTFLNPDETLILSGESLYETADKIYMSEFQTNLSEVKDEKVLPSVVGQEAYDRDASTEGNYAETATHNYDISNAYEAEVIQRSFNAINAVIPKQLQKGIYSVKITSKKGADDKLLYVNRPDISFATGDEGDIATYGGYIKIIGYNLCPNGDITATTVKLVSADKKVYLLPVKESDNNQSVEVVIDNSIPYGDYQIYIHNGYGDNTAWSMPADITIGASPRDAWPKTVFNVKNYGAGGQGLTNDTPAIVRALEEAALNGGGIVYLPKGVYSVVTTLSIPQNVTILGDSENQSVIRFEARRWQYGEAPESLISIIGNVEIKNVAIQGTRFCSIIKQWRPQKARFPEVEGTDNVYFTNTSLRFTPSAGSPSTGGNGGWSTNAITVAEITALISAELALGVKVDLRGNTNNLQWNNFSISYDSLGRTAREEPTFRIWGRQVQLKNSYWHDYSLAATSYGCIIEDCDLESAGFNPSGNGFYMYNNYFHDSWGNNRELMTCDGYGYSMDTNVRFIGDNSELMQKYLGTSELDYTAFIATELKYAIPMVENYNLIVKEGQGRGQARIIKKVKNVTVTDDSGKKQTVSVIFVDKPFTVAPNRRSTIDIWEPRLDFFFVDNVFREGQASGTYGTMINAVWEGNEFSRHSGQRITIHQGQNWYITFLEQRHYEGIYMHGEGFGATGSSSLGAHKNGLNSQFILTESSAAGAVTGFSIRNCIFEEYGVNLSSGGMADGCSGFVIENCTFSDKKSALRITGKTYSLFTAVLLRNNTFDTEEIFDSEYSEYQDHLSETNINRQGYMRVMLINSNYDEACILLGDTNLDGKISVKDATILRLYLVHKVEFDEQQLLRADVNEDSKISLKDVTAIREIILGIYEKPEDNTSSDSSSSETSSDSGSSDTSSGPSGSSSDSSSSSNSSTQSGPFIDNSGWIGGDF